MEIAVTDFAAHTRPLTALVARYALETVAFEGLAHRLMLKVIILAAPLAADVALEHLPSVMPDVALAFAAFDCEGTAIGRFAEWTCAGVLFGAFFRMTNKGFAEIADGADKL